MTQTLNFSDHSDKLYSKACQRLGLLKRTCHFVNNLKMRKSIYLSIVRSIFEHCPYIWKPSSDTTIKKLESLQKRALKWVLHGDIHFTSPSYTANPLLYFTHCKQLNILPIKFRFDYHDIILFHSIVYGYSYCKLPSYLNFLKIQVFVLAILINFVL